jgi:hypothetical protein
MPVTSFGLLFFFAGHLLESTVVALEPVYEHRNYLPSFGLILFTVTLASRLASELPRPSTRVIAPMLIITVAGSLAFLTHERAKRWSDDPAVRLAHLERQERSMRSQLEAAETYAGLARQAESSSQREHLLEQAEARFAKARHLASASPAPEFGLLMFRAEFDEAQRTDELLNALIAKISDGPLSSTAINGTHALIKCTLEGPCRDDIDRERLLMLCERALDNPFTTTNQAKRLLRDKARLQAHAGADIEGALDSLARAHTLGAFSLSTAIDYAHFSARAGRQTKALSLLQEADARDPIGKKFHTIRRMRQAIIRGQVHPFSADGGNG